MLGYGMGVCGLSFEDFGLLTPSEFRAISEARHRYDDYREREAWERARIVGVMSVSPWSGKSVDPKRVLPLPWDQRQEARPEPPEQKPATKEEARRAFEALMRRRREEERRKEK